MLPERSRVPAACYATSHGVPSAAGCSRPLPCTSNSRASRSACTFSVGCLLPSSAVKSGVDPASIPLPEVKSSQVLVPCAHCGRSFRARAALRCMPYAACRVFYLLRRTLVCCILALRERRRCRAAHAALQARRGTRCGAEKEAGRPGGGAPRSGDAQCTAAECAAAEIDRVTAGTWAPQQGRP